MASFLELFLYLKINENKNSLFIVKYLKGEEMYMKIREGNLKTNINILISLTYPADNKFPIDILRLLTNWAWDVLEGNTKSGFSAIL